MKESVIVMTDINIDLTKLLIWLSVSFTLILIMCGMVVFISIYLFGWSTFLVAFVVYAVIFNAPFTIFMYFVCPEVFEVD